MDSRKCPVCGVLERHASNCRLKKAIESHQGKPREQRKQAHYQRVLSSTGKNKRKNTLKQLKIQKEKEKRNELKGEQPTQQDQ